MNGERANQRRRTDHGGLLDDGVVGLLQVAVQDVTEHTGGVLVQVAGSFGHTVVLAPDGNVDALFLWGDKKTLMMRLEKMGCSSSRAWVYSL